MKRFKVSFTLDDDDARYFRSLYRKARRGARELDLDDVIREARQIVEKVRADRKAPGFVREAIDVLADLADLARDTDYAAPKKVRDEIVAGLAYFSNPDDLIPDHVPGLGFLDDAIMIKFIEEEFKHELWGYRRFCKRRDAAEQRPWTGAARDRLEKRLRLDRRKIRREIELRAIRDEDRAGFQPPHAGK